MRLRFNIHQGFPIIGHLFYATWGLSQKGLILDFEACRHHTSDHAVLRGMGLSALELRSRMIGADLKRVIFRGLRFPPNNEIGENSHFWMDTY